MEQSDTSVTLEYIADHLWRNISPYVAIFATFIYGFGSVFCILADFAVIQSAGDIWISNRFMFFVLVITGIIFTLFSFVGSFTVCMYWYGYYRYKNR